MITKERLLEILDKSKPEDKVSFYTEIALSSLIIMNLGSKNNTIRIKATTNLNTIMYIKPLFLDLFKYNNRIIVAKIKTTTQIKLSE